MPITIPVPVPTITIGSTVITHADWENNTPGAISSLANALAERQALLETVGVLSKAISGDVTLTEEESTNLLFIFTGTLAADATVEFVAGFSGLAPIVNQTAGGFSIIVALDGASGETVTIPAGGSAVAYCDGGDFVLADGIVRTSTGASVTGDFAVSGNGSYGGTLSATGAATFGNNVSIVGSLDVATNATVAGTLGVTGDVTLAGGLYIAGAGLNVTNDGLISGDFAVTGNIQASGNITLDTGTLIVKHASTEGRARISAPGSQAAWLEFDTVDSQRWLVGRNATAESGGNAGSDFDLVRFDDSGGSPTVTLRVRRSDGAVFAFELPTSDPSEANRIWCDTGASRVLKLSAG